MICKNCGTDNKPDSKFCEKCGNVLVQESASDIKPMDSSEQKTVIITDVQNEVPQAPQQPAMNAQPFQPVAPQQPVMNAQTASPIPPSPADSVDASDDSTTVLTGELRTPMGGAQSFGSGQTPKFQSQEANPAGTMQQSMPMQPGMQPGAPIQPGPTQPEVKQKAQKPPKAPKEKKQKDPNKKLPTGALVYIILSAVLMAILVLSLLVTGVLTSSKTKKLKNEINDKDMFAKSMEADYESQIADKDTEIAQKEADIKDLENRLSLYQEDLEKSEQTKDSYSKYDPLINFAKDSAKGQGYSDFFVSDTVVHLKNGQIAVKVYFKDASDENTVEFITNDSSIASCSWGSTWDNNCVATLFIENGGSKGNTIVTISNNVNDEKIDIYVFAD